MELQSTVEHMKIWLTMDPTEQAAIHSALHEAYRKIIKCVNIYEAAITNITATTPRTVIRFSVHRDGVTINGVVIEDAPGQLLAFALIMGPKIQWLGAFFWAFHTSPNRSRRDKLNSQLTRILRYLVPKARIAIVNTRQNSKNQTKDVSRFALTWSERATVEGEIFEAHALYQDALHFHTTGATATAVDTILKAISKCDLIPKIYVFLARCLTESQGLNVIKTASKDQIANIMTGIAHCLSWLVGLHRGLTRETIPQQERETINEECLPQITLHIEQLQQLQQMLRRLPELAAIIERNPLNVAIDAVCGLIAASRPLTLMLDLVGPKCQKACEAIFAEAIDLIAPNQCDTDITCKHIWALLVSIAAQNKFYRFPEPCEAPTNWQQQSAILLKQQYFEQQSSPEGD